MRLSRSLRLKDKVMTEYVDVSEEEMKNVAFGGASCPGAWYRNSRGVNWTLYPKDLVSFWWETRTANWQDYIFQ